MTFVSSEGTTRKPQNEAGGGNASEKTDPIRLVMAADEAYAMQMAVALFSVLSHLRSGEKVRVFVLDAGVTAGCKTRVEEVAGETDPNVHLEWACPDVSEIEDIDLDMDQRFSPAIFYRLLIPEVLPNTCHRALYLDSDLVVERSIRPLWETSFSGNAATLAVPERVVSCPKNGVAEWRRLGLQEDDPYFNSGVMLIDVEAWSEQDVPRRAIDYLLNPDREFCNPSDQEALNAVLAGQWGTLDHRWNVYHLAYHPEYRSGPEEMLGVDLTPAIDDPFVIHYTGPEKPWIDSCEHPARDRFFHYLRRSGWFATWEYLQWRGRMAGRRWLDWVKNVTRPYRRQLGLQRDLL